MRTFTLRSFDRPEGGALRPPKDGSASGGGRRPRTHDQGHRRHAGVVLPASELPPIASSCVYSSTFRLFSPAVDVWKPSAWYASELPPIASSCVYSSTFRLFSPAVDVWKPSAW